MSRYEHDFAADEGLEMVANIVHCRTCKKHHAEPYTHRIHTWCPKCFRGDVIDNYMYMDCNGKVSVRKGELERIAPPTHKLLSPENEARFSKPSSYGLYEH